MKEVGCKWVLNTVKIHGAENALCVILMCSSHWNMGLTEQTDKQNSNKEINKIDIGFHKLKKKKAKTMVVTVNFKWLPQRCKLKRNFAANPSCLFGRIWWAYNVGISRVYDPKATPTTCPLPRGRDTSRRGWHGGSQSPSQRVMM